MDTEPTGAAPTEETPAPPPAEEPAGPGRSGPWRSLVIALLVVAVAAAAWFVYRKTRPVQLAEIVPKSCPLLVAADSQWWWKVVQDVRQEPSVRAAMREAEQKLGISFDRDLAAWAGQTAIVLMGMDMSGPRLVFYAQITDKNKFAQSEKRILDAFSKESKTKWKDFSYGGVKLHRAELSIPYGPVIQITAGSIRDWAIVGIGAGTVEKVIDVWNGSSPSISTDPAWKQAMTILPDKPVLWLGVNGEEYFRALSTGMPMALNTTGLAGYVVVASVSEKPDEIRMDGITVATSEKCQNLVKKIKGSSPTPTGKSLKHIPEGAIGTIVLSSPGLYWDAYKQAMTEMFGASPMKAQIEQGLQMIKPVEDAVKAMSGECAISVNYTQGLGFGAVLVGETASSATAHNTALSLQRFAQRFAQKVDSAGGLYKLSMLKYDNPYFRALPCWIAKGEWLAFSTHPSWINGKVPAAGLQMPKEAQGSDSFGMGDFRFIEPLLAFIEKREKPTGVEQDVIGLVRRLELDKATWVAWSKTEPDGKISRSTAILRGWEWRKALRTIIEFASEQEKKAKSRGVPTPLGLGPGMRGMPMPPPGAIPGPGVRPPGAAPMPPERPMPKPMAKPNPR